MKNHEKGETVLFVNSCSPHPLDVIFLISTGLLYKALQPCGNCCSATGNLLTASEQPLNVINAHNTELAVVTLALNVAMRSTGVHECTSPLNQALIPVFSLQVAYLHGRK